MQQQLGVAVGLLAPFKHQCTGGFKRNAGIEVRRHRRIGGIARILTVYRQPFASWSPAPALLCRYRDAAS